MFGLADLPRRARLLISTTILAGVAMLGWQLAVSGAWDMSDVGGFLLVSAMVALAHYFLLLLRHESQQEAFSVAEAAFVLGIMLVRPGPFLLAAGVGAVIGYSLRRVSPLKVAFNFGSYMVGLGLASLVYRSLADVQDVDRSTWIPLFLAMFVFLLVNELSVDLVIAWVEEVPLRSVLRTSLALGIAQWAVNVALGLAAAILWSVDRPASVLLVGPIVLAHLSYRNWLRGRRERDQVEDMIKTAETVSLETDLSERMPELDETPVLASLASTLNRMLERLESAFHRERRFIRDASHELRTPVTITRGYLEMLGDTPAQEDVVEAVDVAMDELDRMGRLITDLTTLAKSEDPGFIVPEPIELAAFLDRIAAKVRSVLDGRLRLGAVPPGSVVQGDEQRLAQALLNLLNNAVVHTDGDSPIVLNTVDRGDAWRFEVADSGGGLPAGEEDAVFQPFRRLNSDRPGSGLGLAIVKGIAEGHGGRAGVDNRPGEGATFWIELPVHPSG
jgi:signal transduction histidine kinase